MRGLVALVFALLAACGQGGDGLTVDDAIYRAPLTDGGLGVAYFSIASKDGLATMEKIDSVELPAGQTVAFAPRGLHLMVFSPQPLDAGATFSIQIAFQSGRIETFPFAEALGTGRQ